jgi:hypothetical protein
MRSIWQAATPLDIFTSQVNTLHSPYTEQIAHLISAVLDSLQIWTLWAILTIRLHILYQHRWIKFSMIFPLVLGAVAMTTLGIEAITHTHCESLF